MSEYQYYEFRAVDRPLTEREIAELRALSTRATITPTSFQNEYNWGDFRGDPQVLMERYFDAHVYVANWGQRFFMLRLPATLLSLDTVERYAMEPSLTVRGSGENLILEFAVEEDAPDWVEGEGWLDSLLPLRDDIARGDLRALYLGWLGSIWLGDEEDDDELREPPVPPGLRTLTIPLQRLVEFLALDPDLIEVAAQRSAPIEVKPESIVEWRAWLQRAPGSWKDAALIDVMRGEGMAVRARLLRRFREDIPFALPAPEEERRTMRELLTAAEELREERRREKERRAPI